MFFKIGFLCISLIQFIGWEIIFFNGIYEEEQSGRSSGVLNNLIIFFIYVICNGICWFSLLFGDTLSTELKECTCIKYLFKTTKYCLQDLGYYSRSVLSKCSLFIVMAMCISAVNLSFGGCNLYLSIEREIQRKTNPDLPSKPGFIISAVKFNSIFCLLSLITFTVIASVVIDIAYQIYNTEPCPECSINGYCSSKLKLKREQETWKRRRRLHLFTTAFFGKEFANKMFPFDEDYVKFDFVFNRDQINNNGIVKNHENNYVPLYKPENIVVTNYIDKTL
ncbi:hypothetical protein H8356DRAFT_1687169 [Neocallimastix lanati (nom. inval.)]|jgi:hypothetical protein|uniref:Uncharacterized protein n=1 Tax=Neocallimastix californiae TaxID=1754190 RepID=A0A1Y2DIM6_9FUNG|nr:hypothetical protein H8356DRAFT_1687169 [Neocallimastix sp. JGI-2020a]ORY58984.1 hypothetical protein LY90DRAFT_668944 [Neocallimastix californiae]|eukprot:ORY58984.1 hypothetical protein LY90DRAFT_668944 [Neocallimastix californiae]